MKKIHLTKRAAGPASPTERNDMREITVAATQMCCTDNREENIATAEKLVRDAAGKGARIILLQEL